MLNWIARYLSKNQSTHDFILRDNAMQFEES